jgi:branched-chain amino acid transport system ATP-binding protein
VSGGIGTPVLAGTGLTKRYGDLTVLDSVDFTVAEGEAVGIVGPNGAGKTTLLSLLSGSTPATSGHTSLLGADVTHARPEVRCRRGIGRAFQVPRPFGGMTVLENVLVGASFGGGLHGARGEERAIDVLELCGLLPLANRRAESLGLLSRKRLELARALATRPRLLLLDEIAGGLTEAECQALVGTVAAIHRGGTTIIWIEHIVHALLAVVGRLTVLNFGRKIAEGEARGVMDLAEVREIYLGSPV